MKLFFVRHGESEANTRHIISNRESTFHLTDVGYQQAEALAETLKDIPLTTIYASPVLRARETAEIVSQAFELPYQITEALREYDCGILEEQGDEESWRMHGEVAEDWIVHRNYTRKPEGGECFLDIQERFLPFIESLMQDREDHTLLIGHGGLFQLMLPLVLTNVDHDFVLSHGLGHTECVVAELCSDQWVCLQWGDVQF